jgi:hypothetical protein
VAGPVADGSGSDPAVASLAAQYEAHLRYQTDRRGQPRPRLRQRRQALAALSADGVASLRAVLSAQPHARALLDLLEADVEANQRAQSREGRGGPAL